MLVEVTGARCVPVAVPVSAVVTLVVADTPCLAWAVPDIVMVEELVLVIAGVCDPAMLPAISSAAVLVATKPEAVGQYSAPITVEIMPLAPDRVRLLARTSGEISLVI